MPSRRRARETPRRRRPVATSMIDSGFSAFSLRLLRRSHHAMPRRATYGRRSSRACVPGSRMRARYAWYSTSSVHSSSPWHSSVRAPWRSTTTKSGSSVAPGRPREAFAQQEVAVAVADEQRHAGVGDAAQRRDDGRDERIAHLVVADPPVEEVAEDVDARRRARAGPRRKRMERGERRRTLGRQVQVGQEERRTAAATTLPHGVDHAGTTSPTPTSACDFLGLEDHDVVFRDVLVESAVARRHRADLVDDVLARRRPCRTRSSPSRWRSAPCSRGSRCRRR